MYRAIPLCALCLIILGVLSSFITGLISGVISDNLVLSAGSISYLLFACISPRAALACFCFVLPLFGNKPGTSQSFYLFLLSAGIATGLLLRTFNAQREVTKELASNRILTLVLAYMIASFVSLLSLPWNEFIQDFKSQVPTLYDFSALGYRLLALANAHEETFNYSVLSFLWTSLAVSVALSIFFLYRNEPSRLLGPLIALFCGLFASLSVGILDYYSILDLRLLRALDPVVNPGDQEFRLQSFFGHSGWFAEYVTLLMPTSMVLLLLPLRFGIRLLLLLFVMLVGEFVLILTFQRGGWVSYPLTLFAIWTAIYVSRRLEKGETDFGKALRSSFIKILLSIPITVVLSMSLLWGLSQSGLLGSESTLQLSTYAGRLKDVSKTSDRTDFMRAGIQLGLLSPWIGLGSESFAFQYEREYQDLEGAFFNQIILPLHGSAHNVYVQTFAGKGLLGLMLLLGIFAFLIKDSLIKSLRDLELDLARRIILLLCATFGAAFLIYGMVQEVFYVSALQFVCFIMVGIACAGGGSKERGSLITPLLIAIFAISLILETFFPRSKQPIQECSLAHEYGCYKTERDQNGRLFRWCGVRALQLLKLNESQDLRSIPLSISFPRGGHTPATLQIMNGDILLKEINVAPGETVHTEVLLPAESGPVCKDNTVPLSFRSAYYVLPARDNRASSDTRTLSFRIY